MESTPQPGHDNPARPFPIVGIGASAGGLSSLVRFLSVLPDEFGVALVFMQHLSASHKSFLPELLSSRKSALIIEEVSDGLTILPGRLYICPPAQEVKVEKGIFRMISHARKHVHLPIDEFFISLSEDAAERAIAVIFSGAGTDGARGVHAIRAAGGTVFVEDPQTAEFSSMPLAALGTGQVDAVLTPEDIAREIVKFHTSGVVSLSPDSVVTPAHLEPFYRLISEKTGYRFNHYKKSVVSRRIKRRMYLHGLSSVSAYLEKIATDDTEAALLASDLMIGVTSFFRDRLAWEALHIEVTRKLVAEEGSSPLRVWTSGCATGEEAYSIAMLLQHELDRAGKKRDIQVFATDVNDRALEKAREGTYPATIAADVPADYLAEFFSPSEDGLSLSINKEIRQHVIFAKQDILTDPPFSRLDLVICRNLFIYLEPDVQEKCIALFHYALKEGGYLFLGGAESPGRSKGLFASLAHKKCRIYRKIETSMKTPLAVPFASEHLPPQVKQASSPNHRQSAVELSQDVLLEEYAPAAVTINENYDILYNNGPTNRYLRPPHGASTLKLLELLPENVRNRVRGALFRAGQDVKPVSVRAGIPDDSGRPRQVTVRISKLRENLYLVIFREKGSLTKELDAASPEIADMEESAVRQLERELSTTRDDLQSHIEQLKGLNEELHSSNEELQAANEELETSREELQSLNEELTTVNAQLQTKIEDEEGTNNDLNNFLTSTNIPTIFLDDRFRVKRFTPAMVRLIKLLPGDVGRPIIDMSQEHIGPDLVSDAQSVLEHLTPVVRELGINGAWYVRNILPYRTSDNRIEGVVITYADITQRKRQEEETRRLLAAVQEEKDRLSALVNNIQDEVWLADTNKRFVLVNPSALREFGLDAANELDIQTFAESLEVYRPDGTPRRPDEAPPLRALQGEAVRNQEEIVRTPGTGELRYRQVSSAPIRDQGGSITGSVSVVHDITERRQAEERLRISEEHYRSLFENMLNGYAYCKMLFDENGPKDFTYLSVNAAFETLTGLKDVAGKNVSEVIPGIRLSDPEMFEIYGRVALTGTPERFENYVEALGMWFSISVYSPRKEYFVAVFDVITERKRMEEALRRSRDELEERVLERTEALRRQAELLELAYDVIIVRDLDNRVFFWNARAREVYGFTRDEALGRVTHRLLQTRFPVPFEEHMEALTTQGRWEGEITHTTKDDRQIVVLSRQALQRDESGQPVAIMEINLDITERKRNENALRRQAALLDLSPDAIMVREMDGTITLWGHGAELLYGWTEDEARGRTSHGLLKTKFPEPLEKIDEQVRLFGQWSGELVHAAKDGHEVVVQSRWLAQRNVDGTIAEILESNVDITEARRMEAHLRQVQKMEALGTLTGGIAHDFNNILAAIIGFTELMAGHAALGSRDAHHIERVMEAAIRGRELVRQMLTFSRKTEQEKKPLRVSSIVKETVRLIRATTPTTINIRVNALSESDFVLADPTQIQQVLMNLCTNATHAMRESGGSLDIELDDYTVPPSNGNPHGIEPGRYVKLTVRDTGIGISPDIVDKIFDPFFTTKKLGEGSGLGLSVVHGIVKQHDGYITVESEPGKGSIFAVYLPRIAGELETDAVSEDESPRGSERILFVDDEEALAEIGEDILAELGYEVASRMNGHEALALFKLDPSRFDLVITDQTMPGMTGIELAGEILAVRADMPIIMSTGFSYAVDADKAMAAGIKAFAMKPLTKREIAGTIRKVLDE